MRHSFPVASVAAILLFFFNIVCKVDCGDRDSKLVCGRRVLTSVAINLELYWNDVLVFYAIYVADASLQLDVIGDG